MKRHLYFSFLYVLTVLGFSQVPNNIKSIQLKIVGQRSNTIIALLGNSIELSFDDLEADSKEYQYKIQYMTFDWQESSLLSNQYINGFDQNMIINSSQSFNTLQEYTHYSFQIPNKNTVLTKSGNYIISVLNEDDEPIFSRRITFYEKAATVGVAVYRSRDTRTINEQQTVQFSVFYPNIVVNNPTQEIKIALIQNGNWQTTITNLQPQFFKKNQLIYNYTKETNFWGGNEFLNFDNKIIRNTSVSVQYVKKKSIYHNYLYLHKPRAETIYHYNPDINGQFIIRSLEGNNSETEADYAMIHFYLEAVNSYQNKEVYVYGGFNNFELLEENKMTYSNKEGLYKASILLKQGFYNYRFVTKDENKKIDFTIIDGSYYQTENNYTVLVYFKPFGGLYDRVIGVGNGFFNQNK